MKTMRKNAREHNINKVMHELTAAGSAVAAQLWAPPKNPFKSPILSFRYELFKVFPGVTTQFLTTMRILW